MISVEDAVKLLRESGERKMCYFALSKHTASQIADLIEHLNNKCDLEVNELLGDDDGN